MSDDKYSQYEALRGCGILILVIAIIVLIIQGIGYIIQLIGNG